MNKLNLKNISFVVHHPSILKNIIQGKSKDEIRAKARRLNELQFEQESIKFISSLKKISPHHTNTNYKPKLNRLCYIEDWDDKELKNIIYELQNPIYETYIHRKEWTTRTNKIIGMRKPGFIHRKDWEWALGIIAMKRFGKLNNKCNALGIGAGREEVLFYLANTLKHVYATDIYNGKDWDNFAPSDFPENPRKYAPFPYKEDALTALRMDATKLEFPSNTFDIAFSFSSIEHFGGENHSGALKGLREIERVLKPGGIAVITTEYIINNKEHFEFFNRRTIYSDLIDKTDTLKLVEPLDLRITNKTLDTVMNYPECVYWDTSSDEEFKKTHPLIFIRVKDILLTSIMLVFQKQR
ncbi:MAG: methyltransferase domain-containing protein [Nitrososphaeraceae archaeon]